jgi:hypothetical protein
MCRDKREKQSSGRGKSRRVRRSDRQPKHQKEKPRSILPNSAKQLRTVRQKNIKHHPKRQATLKKQSNDTNKQPNDTKNQSTEKEEERRGWWKRRRVKGSKVRKKKVREERGIERERGSRMGKEM